MPLWLAAGFADFLCHRAARIEATSGYKESLIHLLMLAEVGVVVLMGLFLEITSLVIVSMLLLFLAHERTSYWDLRFALKRRVVGALEQNVHSYLGMIPFMALSFVVILHWPQTQVLVGAGPYSADWSLRLKEAPLPIPYVAGILAAITCLELIPYLQELLRGLRIAAGRRS